MLTFTLIIACGQPTPSGSLGPPNNHNPGEGPPNHHRVMEAVTTPAGEYEPIGTLAEDPLSILLISWDTTRTDRLGRYGGRVPTPNLDSLAAQGGTWTQAISHFPETALSHWSILTGVQPELHGNIPGTGSSRYSGPTLAEIAGSHGYATGAFIGGVTLTASASGLQRGFDLYDDQWDWQRTDMKRSGDDVVDNASNWITSQDGDYFAFVHLFDAHHPYAPPAPFDTMFEADGPRAPDVEAQLALYDGELAYLDQLLGRLLAVVDEDTIIVVTSDHGESFEHEYLYNHRESLWDNTLLVPLIIRGGEIPAASTHTQQVALTDILPTVLEIAGLPTERKIQGSSLTNGHTQTRVFSSTDPWFGERQLSARTQTAKGIWRDGREPLGYNLLTDPNESDNLGEIPESLVGADAQYNAEIRSGATLQRAELPSRHITPQRVEQLEALGYVGER